MAGTRRLFVAISPPDDVRGRVAALAGRLRAAAAGAGVGLRWVSPENLHVTLKFLGAVPEERVPSVEAAVRAEAGAGRPLALEVGSAGGFPSTRRPRAVWLGLSGDTSALAALAAGIGQRLAALGFPLEDRAFSPHLTIARSRERRGAAGLERALASAAVEAPVPWRVHEVLLVQSHLSPRGSRHEAIARAPLGG